MLNINGNPNQVLRSELDGNWQPFPRGSFDIFSSITLQPDLDGFIYRYNTSNFYQFGIIPGELYEYRFSIIAGTATNEENLDTNLFIGSDVMDITRYVMSHSFMPRNNSNAISTDDRSATIHIVARDYITFQGGLGSDPIKISTARFMNYRRIGTKLEF